MYLTISEVLGIMGKLKIFKSDLPNQKQSTRGEIYQIKSNQRVGKLSLSALFQPIVQYLSDRNQSFLCYGNFNF